MSMTENEAKSYMENEIRCIQRARVCDRDCAQCKLVKEEEPLIEAFGMAITALEEIQSYRVIGTVEELKSMKENGAFTGVELAQIATMQMKLKEYQSIGTVNEIKAKLAFLNAYQRADSDGRLVLILDKDGFCKELGMHIDEIRAVVERMKPKEVKRFKKHDEMLYQCGVCGRDVFSNHDKYCAICGQVLDWSEEVIKQ